ncbi:hypothetical protein ES708_13772 [subsurface metagenome]
MKLEKAIEILDTHQCDMPRDKIPYLIAAIKLGIEALKHRREHRDHDPNHTYDPLPGEAED